MVLGYTAFCGCFEFPLVNRHGSIALDFRDYICFCKLRSNRFLFSRIYGIAKERKVYALTFLFTAIGIVCRYFLEFGEVSNIYNFTFVNIVSYLLIIPTGTTIAYHFIGRGMRKQPDLFQRNVPGKKKNMQSIWRATKCKIPVCRRTQIHKNGRFGGRSRTIKNIRTYLYTSIGASLIFILTAVWYMEGSFYPGPLPIGIVAGIVLLIQIALLILCIRNILTFRFQWIIALTMLMSGFSILGTGFSLLAGSCFYCLKNSVC